MSWVLAIAGGSALAQLPLPPWLIVKGVNAERRKEQASAAGASVRT
ncbi:MAG: hypothetical protein ACM3SU_03765 [Acidobacteriota bacterium]